METRSKRRAPSSEDSAPARKKQASASVGTTTAKRAKVSGSKKEASVETTTAKQAKASGSKKEASVETTTAKQAKASGSKKEASVETTTAKPAKASGSKKEASVGTTTAKQAKASGSKKDTLPKSESKSEAKDKGVKDSKKKTPDSASAHLNADGTRTSVWLMKSEPDTFSIDDLINSKDSTSHWEGVRNHEAKNLMKNSMKIGDQVLFYHSNTKEPGIVALAKIAKEAYPDHSAFDPKSDYFDSKSDKSDPRWFMVDVQFDRKLKRTLTLKELQEYKDKELKDMKLLNRGRLSVQPVSDAEMEFIMKLENEEVATE